MSTINATVVFAAFQTDDAPNKSALSLWRVVFSVPGGWDTSVVLTSAQTSHFDTSSYGDIDDTHTDTHLHV